ncbi:hypothetical protein J5690_03765 [bacterium]|nr:hypothetical protein [bacterium]
MICSFTLAADPQQSNTQPKIQPQQQAQQQTPQQQVENKQEAKAEKTYIFNEELIDPPIKAFTMETINENELLNADKQALKLYETAVNEEKQPNLIKHPEKALKMWQELAGIAQNNPFLKIAEKRAAEWKTCIEVFEKHQESLDKLKMFVASSILPANQKITLASKYFEEFGLTFGTLEVEKLFQKLPDKDAVTGDDAFKAMIRNVKQQRCNRNSGKDCYEAAENSTTMEYEKTMLLDKACELKYQPACTKQQQAKPQVQPQQTEEKPAGYELAEEVVGLIRPCPVETLNAEILMNADTQTMQLFESTVNLEKQKETLKNPESAITAWQKITQAEGNNPFKTVAGERIAEWKSYIEKIGSHREDIAKITATMTDSALTIEQKTDAAIKYLDESGVNFGTLEIINAVALQPDIKKNETFGTKITGTRKKRCELGAGKDCQLYADYHAANETEKAEYLEKACKLEVKEACPDTAAQAPQAEQPQSEEKAKEPEKPEDPIEKEWRRLRNTRIAVATTSLVLGAAAAGLGGFSFYEMNKAKDKRDGFYNDYKYSSDQELVKEYRRKAEKQDKKYKKYMMLGGIGVGVGAALVATGITFYSIEFKKEKELKQKCNISFSTNPFDGNIYFTLNW